MRDYQGIEGPCHDDLDEYLYGDSNTMKDWGAAPPVTPVCAENHGPLKIPVKDKVYEIWGVSATKMTPPDDVDVFVGLDRGMIKVPMRFPWVDGDAFLYEILDTCAPDDLASFKELLKYLRDNLVAGKKVWVGCIGGHGRTGLVLAALYTFMTGDKDSIAKVREQVCHKCVESLDQVDWLAETFGIKKVKPSRRVGTIKFSDKKMTPATTPPKVVSPTASKNAIHRVK